MITVKASVLVAAAAFLCGATAQNQTVEPDLDPSKPPKTPGAKFATTKHGPFKVGSMSMMENRPFLNVEKPCGDCYVVALQAGLEYPNGTVANVDTGAWLHHMVLYTNNFGEMDPVCPIMPMKRVYASGNERSCARINDNEKYGIRLDGGSPGGILGGGGLLGGLTGGSIGMLVDLMNMSDEDQEYVMTMTYEYVEGDAAEGYKPVTVAWLDVTGNCGISYVPAREGQFDLKSRGWISTVSGRLLFAYGHEHSGGVSTTIIKNGEALCTSVMQYGMVSNGSMDDMPDMPESMTGATSCKDFGDVRVGDRLVIDAKYDTDKHPLDQEMDGSGPMPIMGISRVYIGA